MALMRDSVGQALVRALRRSFGLLWAAARTELQLLFALQIVSSLCLVVQLLLLRRLLHVLIAPHGHSDVYAGLAATLVAIGVLSALGTFAASLSFERQRLIVELVKRHAMRRILAVTTTVDLAEFERPEFNDALARVRNDALSRPYSLVAALTSVAQSAFTAAGLLLTLGLLTPLMLPIVVVGVAPMIWLQRRSSRHMHAVERSLTTVDRRRGYLETVLSTLAGAKETRAFGLAPFLGGAQEELAEERVTAYRRLVRSRSIRAGAIAVIGAIVFAGGLALLVWLVVDGGLSTATAATTALVVQQLTVALRTAAVGGGQIYENSLFLNDVNEFMARAKDAGDFSELVVETTPTAPADPLQAELSLTGVTFAYPDTACDVLQDISMTIPAGAVVAIVGENGSGKTTLTKLLTGLYAPTRGTIRWDGVDVTDVPPEIWRRRFAVVFQDFVRYELSARINVAIGRPEGRNDDKTVRAAAAFADADDFLSRLGAGYDTVLSRAYDDGADLSIGQWQRLALARAVFCTAPVLVLDEPTSALDPRVEQDLLGRVRALAGDRTIVLVSHRLSSVRYADRIFVLREGRLVEQGTHDELFAESGHYFDLFTIQASAYAMADRNLT